MIIESVRLHNWVTIADADIKLGPVPFLITGENRDELSATSNGAGKSLLSQSIVWVLFDDILRKGMKKDQVIGRNDEWASVNIIITKDAQTFDITRYRNHPEYGDRVDISIDGEDVSQHKTKSVAEWLDIRESTVYYCAYSHADTQPIVAFSPAKFTEAVSEILEIERFDKYIREARRHGSKAAVDAEFFEKQIIREQEIVEVTQHSIASLEKRYEKFEKLKESNVNDFKIKISETKKTISGYDEIISNGSGIEAELDELSEQVEMIETLNSKLKKLQQSLDKSRKRENTHQKRLGAIVGRFNEIDAAYNNLFNNPSGYCSYCGNSMADSETHAEILEEISKNRDESLVEKVAAEVDLREAEQDSAKTVAAMSEIESQLADLQESAKRFSKLAKKMEVIDKAVLAKGNLVEKLESLEERMAEEAASSPIDIEEIKNEAEKRLAEQLKELSKVSGNCAEAKLKKSDSDILMEVLKSMKTDIVNNFVRDFSEELQDNLDEMTDGDYSVNLEVKKGAFSFTFSQKSKDGISLPYSLFSRGEQARIAKATSTALESILNIGFVIDDEGIGGVDPAGVEAILSFIMKKNEGKTFLFVSHTPSVTDFFEGSNNIHVTKEDGTTSVEVREL